ncbi:hypothetical protein FOL47_008874 [Perkinsus chesapeaki]|uniref:Uncharacterized protein n=1 Tax=Perkinsus chesapeaki TaxID=330153 RepID=A0A7J6MT26_PERCH|nr:hypothetical protein FOL47_008874 [Perkinsus chesapeaki]
MNNALGEGQNFMGFSSAAMGLQHAESLRRLPMAKDAHHSTTNVRPWYMQHAKELALRAALVVSCRSKSFQPARSAVRLLRLLTYPPVNSALRLATAAPPLYPKLVHHGAPAHLLFQFIHQYNEPAHVSPTTPVRCLQSVKHPLQAFPPLKCGTNFCPQQLPCVIHPKEAKEVERKVELELAASISAIQARARCQQLEVELRYEMYIKQLRQQVSDEQRRIESSAFTEIAKVKFSRMNNHYSSAINQIASKPLWVKRRK